MPRPDHTARETRAPQAFDVEVVQLDRYPQLKQLAWGRHRPTVTGREALAFYERNWRHVDQAKLDPNERELLKALADAYGNGVLLV